MNDTLMTDEYKAGLIWRLFYKAFESKEFYELRLFLDGSGNVIDDRNRSVLTWEDFDEAIQELQAYLSQQ